MCSLYALAHNSFMRVNRYSAVLRATIDRILLCLYASVEISVHISTLASPAVELDEA